MDIFSRQKRSEIMSRVKSSGTDIEMRLLQHVRPLWKTERYRRNAKNVPGKPDIVFPKSKIAIFADGDFWHGHNYKEEKKSYKKFWRDKIAGNIKRDKEVNRQLKSEGWKVLRFWKTEIKKDPDKCAQRINKMLKAQQSF